MKNLKILFGVFALVLLFSAIFNVVNADITEGEWVGAYIAVTDDIAMKKGKFTEAEYLDLIWGYLGGSGDADLNKAAFAEGPKSGEPIHYLLNRAGVNECIEGFSCSTPGERCCAENPNTGKYEEFVCQ